MNKNLTHTHADIHIHAPPPFAHTYTHTPSLHPLTHTPYTHVRTLTTRLISVQPASAVMRPIPTDVAAWIQSGMS